MTTNGNIRERSDAGPEAVDDIVVVPTVPEPVESPSPSDFELPGRYLAVKYAASRLLAAILLVLSLPLLLVIAAALRLQLGKGVLYRQARVGRDGRTFEILKFRTMLEDRRQEAQPVEADRRLTHKSDEDPRHTRLGRFLRKTSLDELPQLWNVIRGEMTLVGPRPELASVVEQYDFRDHPRHVVLPGITGLWQVSSHRHDLLHEHLDLDIEYVQKVSLRLDLAIVVQTLLLFVRPTGR